MAYRNYWDAVLRLKDEDEDLYNDVLADLLAKMNSGKKCKPHQDSPPTSINLEEMI